MKKTNRWKIKKVLQEGKDETDVFVKGWVRTRRDSKGGFSFIEINDGSCLKNLQVVTDHNMDGFDTASKKLHTGSCVGFGSALSLL
jgi:asparaginyl-tRNA synthetase